MLVPASLDGQAAYGPFVDMAARHAGPEARSLLSTYFSCGDADELVGLFERAGLDVTVTSTEHGTARFPSVEALVATEVNSTPLGERLTPEVYELLLTGAREVLAPFTGDDGTLTAPFDCTLVAARRP